MTQICQKSLNYQLHLRSLVTKDKHKNIIIMYYKWKTDKVCRPYPLNDTTGRCIYQYS